MFTSERIAKLAHDLRIDVSQVSTLYHGSRLELIEASLGLAPVGQLGERLRRCEAASANPLGGVNAKVSLILFGGIYSVELLRMNPDKLFVFGDTNQRVGKGGQAVIRDEPNALGVSTKVSVDRFMTDCVPDMAQVCEDLFRVEQMFERGKRVVIHITPEKRVSLGCGLAQLPYRAPRVYGFIEHWFENMKAKHRHATI